MSHCNHSTQWSSYQLWTQKPLIRSHSPDYMCIPGVLSITMYLVLKMHRGNYMGIHTCLITIKHRVSWLTYKQIRMIYLCILKKSLENDLEHGKLGFCNPILIGKVMFLPSRNRLDSILFSNLNRPTVLFITKTSPLKNRSTWLFIMQYNVTMLLCGANTE